MNAFLWEGLTGTILIGLIMVLRFTARKRLPGRLFVWLWMVAVIRLCFPLSISVQLPSLPQPIQNLMPVPTKEIRESGEKPEKTSDISTSEPGDSVNTITMKTTDKEAETDLVYIPETDRKADYKADHIKVWSAEKLLNLIWITGALCCLLFHTLRGRNERKVLNQAIPISKKVERKLYQNTLGFCQNRIDIRYFGFKKNGQLMIPFFLSDRICTPSAFGVFRQKIILPAHLSLEDGRSLGYVLLHEMVHIRKRDNLMKLIALAAVCLHWFNPFVWMMLYFLERDIELSCDQEVLSLLGKEERKGYAGSLLALAAEYERYGILSSGFGKKELKERVVSIMKYKEKTRKSVLAAVLILILSMSVFVRAENSVIVNAEDPETVKMDKDWITRRYYDASGTLKSTQERYFNENNQLIGENYYYEMGEALGSTNEYILDEKGRFQEGTMYSLDGNFLAATSGYEYDEKDRLLHVTQTGEEENGDTKQFSYEYDDHDQCVKATTVFDHGEHQRDVRTENTYDADLLIRSISYSKTYAVADGPENAEELFGSDAEFLYDDNGKLIRENRYSENGVLIEYYEYEYVPVELETDTTDRELDISPDVADLSPENMNAETSIEKALSYLSILYSGKAFKKELCTSTYEEMNDWYVVNVNDEDYNYEVFIDAEDGMLCYLYYSAQGIDWEANACTLPDGLIEEKYGMVKAAVQEIYGNNKDFISTSCEYNLKIEDHIIPHGNINYLFEFENDQAVRVLYNVQEDTFWMIQYLGSYEAYENQGFGEYAENHYREQGIERQKIYFDSLNE